MTERVYDERLKKLEKTLGTLIVWIVQSANSPISPQNARDLLKMLGTEEERK